jgi:hypothetical protein
MGIYDRVDDDAAILRQRLEMLTSQLAELDELRDRVLEAERRAEQSPAWRANSMPADTPILFLRIAPRRPQALHTNGGSRSDRRTLSGRASATSSRRCSAIN